VGGALAPTTVYNWAKFQKNRIRRFPARGRQRSNFRAL